MTPPTKEYREIPLTQGQVAYVSPHRFEEINAFKWYAFWSKLGSCFYAARTEMRNGKKRTNFMHRQVAGLDLDDQRTADHDDCNRTLDNTDGNVRLADRSQQAQNRGKRSDNTSGFKCVRLDKEKGKWRVVVVAYKKRIHIGYFATRELAVAAYLEAVKRIHGEFARVV